MAILNSTFGPGLFGTGMRTADFRDSNNDGIDDRDQGFQNLPGFNRGINLPINIDNNPLSNPIQDGMFRPPMQQPVQNQMPVAGSFLDQLQQSTQVLNNQIRNVVPQNRFVGNQFQMPFNFGGGFGYSPSNFTYTPGAFNQYGNIPVTGTLPPAVSTTPTQGREGREGDRGAFGNQTSMGGLERIGDMNLSISPTGRIEVLDPNSLSSQLLSSISEIQKFTPTGLLGSALGGLTDSTEYGRQLDRIEAQFGKPVADEIAATVRESYGIGKAVPSGVLSMGQETPTTQINTGGLMNQNPVTGEITNVTNTNPNTGLVSNVMTGFNPNVQNINNPAAQAAISANATPAQLGQTVAAIGRAGGREGGQGTGGGKSCFVKGTMLQMADGTEKEISTVELGDDTKGGIVEMTMQGLPQTIYNYKDVLVSGSHWVIEDNEFVAVEDSKHGVLTDKVEPVYTLKTSDHRMWINDIEFGDFETGSDNDWEPHFEMVRQKLNKELRDGK